MQVRQESQPDCATGARHRTNPTVGRQQNGTSPKEEVVFNIGTLVHEWYLLFLSQRVCTICIAVSQFLKIKALMHVVLAAYTLERRMPDPLPDSAPPRKEICRKVDDLKGHRQNAQLSILNEH